MSSSLKFTLGQKVDVKDPMTSVWRQGVVSEIICDTTSGEWRYNITLPTGPRFHRVPEEAIEERDE